MCDTDARKHTKVRGTQHRASFEHAITRANVAAGCAHVVARRGRGEYPEPPFAFHTHDARGRTATVPRQPESPDAALSESSGGATYRYWPVVTRSIWRPPWASSPSLTIVRT